jgi:superfamily II DNA or RNA helicase
MKDRNVSHCIHFYDYVKESENSKNMSLTKAFTKKFLNKSKITEKTKDRNIIFNGFKENGGHLLSCKTISYGIDIPECDSVFLSYIGNSIPDLIQKIMRGIRKYTLKPDKITYVFVLMDCCELKEGDITKDVKETQQQLIYKIACMLQSGIDIDLLHPKKNTTIIDELKIETTELQNILDENENDSIFGESRENIQDMIQNTNDCIKKEKQHQIQFSDFFDDNELQVWYNSGEIKSNIVSNDKKWEENFNELKEYVDINKQLPPESYDSLGTWCSTQRKNYRKNNITTDRIELLESITA